MQERVLITGATGFVGGWLSEEFQKNRPDARLFGTSHSKTADVPEGVTLLPCDITDADSVRAVVRAANPNRVVHLAGIASAAGTNAAQLRTVNADAAITLLRAVREMGNDCQVLLASSGYVYGATAPGILAKETDPLHAVGAYAESKVAMESAAEQFQRTEAPVGVSLVLARAFNHTGARQTDAFVVPAFARQIARIEAGLEPPVVKVGNLDALRDFLHVGDVVRAYRQLVCDTVTGSPVTVVNVASGVGVTIRHILEELVALSAVRVAVETDPARLRPSDLPECVGSYERLQALTGWTPRIRLADTVREILDYFRARTAA